MPAYRRVYDSRHLQANCQEPGSAPEPYARQSIMGYLYLFNTLVIHGKTAVMGKLFCEITTAMTGTGTALTGMPQ